VCASQDECSRVLGQLNSTIRANYSNPPTHGARIISLILSDPDLHALWSQELASMRDRIREMRSAIHDGLSAKTEGANLAHYLSQRGMFTFTGLSAAQVKRLRAEMGVYLLKSGRMCVAGLNHSNIQRVVAAVAEVM
jgi:aromatic-amino-acid transaminase